MAAITLTFEGTPLLTYFHWFPEASESDPKFNLIYGIFWNGALNLDINDYNMFLD